MKLEELKQRMRGVFIIVVTPFRGNEDIDYEGLRANLQYTCCQRLRAKIFRSPLVVPSASSTP
jgi:dihydrodipicolinate synthase/N-acetylneuraminate lyase